MTKANQMKVEARRLANSRKRAISGLARAKKVPGLSMRKLRIRA